MNPSSKEYFARVADQWDELRKGYFSESVRQKAISLSGVGAGALVADIGAGTGFVTEGLLRLGARVIAVDESSEMLEEARTKLGSKGPIEFRLGSADSIPIEDGGMDYVFANMLLHHVQDPQQVIFEFSRILKPGGRAVLTDLDEHDSVFLRTEHHDRWMGFSREAVGSWFERAGMEDVKVTGLDEKCCASSSSGADAKIGIFVALGRKGLTK